MGGREYGALVVAALVLLLVLVVAFMALQLYNLRKPAPCDGSASALRRREEFMGSAYYTPSCSSEWLGRRRAECRGLTSGAMPSIDMFGRFGNGLCCGRLGIPP